MMIHFWILLVFLSILIVLDLRSAWAKFKAERKGVPLFLHAVLLSILVFIVINTIFVILGTSIEIPYFDFYISKVHNLVIHTS